MNVETDKGAEFVHGSSSQAAAGDAGAALWIEATPRILWNALGPTEDGHTIWLFAGSDGGGEAAAVFYTLIETAKANGHNPRLWLTRALETIGRDRDLTDLDALMPWAMPPETPNPA